MRFKLNENDTQVHPNRLGTEAWDANEGRNARIEYYRRLTNMEEDLEITEDNIDDWALRKTCTKYNRGYDRVKAELLGQQWSELEC